MYCAGCPGWRREKEVQVRKGNPPTADVTRGHALWLWSLGWIWGPHPYSGAWNGFGVPIHAPQLWVWGGFGVPFHALGLHTECFNVDKKKPETTQILNSY